MWRQVRLPAAAVMCETRDLGIKWPHWYTLIFKGDRNVDMRYVCPKDVKNMLLQQARTAKHQQEEFEERVFGWSRPWHCCGR